ncbi:MAG: alcohol dehydrogenase catalytic domain-containing protein [Chloroflexi bacterium]|nr:alcohol dehydrogenase catalytic domain-containing protein [Chloroflexota bacterium]
MSTYRMAFIPEPGKIDYREMTIREPGAKEVMIKVKAAAICGSDLHLFKGKHPSAALPAAVGHEMAGEVVNCGYEVTRFKEGDRVTVEPVIACGVCYFCLRGQYNLCASISFQYRQGQGTFADYFYAPEHRVYKLPENVSFQEGALIEPCSVALHAVRTSKVKIGQTSAVIGAGAIGILVSKIVGNLTGVKPFVTDLNPFRVKRAIEMGSFDTSKWTKDEFVDRIYSMTDNLGVHAVFEAVGVEATLNQAMHVVRKGGRITLLGIFEVPTLNIPVNLFVQKEISVTGSQGYVWDFQDSINLISSGQIQIQKLITSQLPFSKLQYGFGLLMMPGNEQIKIVFELD